MRADIARHYNNIATMDVAIGALLDRLEAEGIAENTIVIFASDHGDGLPRMKRWLYDSGLHVPLIVRWPGVTHPGSVTDRLVSLVDLPATILAMAGVEVPEWMEGQVFLGADASPPREYVFAARDRIDEQPDTVRAARDARWKYIRHYHPELPYVLEGSFRDQMPMMQELHAMNAEGTLDATASLWFRSRRDEEELFDTESDPHEVVNLVRDPAHAATLERMRAALDRWIGGHEDLGFLPEEALRERFFPDGTQPVTEAPEIVIEGDRARVACATEGASIEYRVEGGRWRLYTEPVRVEPGQRVSARAQRHGWEMSEETSASS